MNFENNGSKDLNYKFIDLLASLIQIVTINFGAWDPCPARMALDLCLKK